VGIVLSMERLIVEPLQITW